MMTSRERLLRCMRHEPIDRVPVSTYELNGWNMQSFENREPSYTRLMDRIREATDCIYMAGRPVLRNSPDLASETVTWQEGISHYTRTIFHAPGGDLSTLHRTDDSVVTTWTIKHMLESLDDIGTYLALPWQPADVDMQGFFTEQEQLGDRGVMMISWADPICVAAELFEMSVFLTHAVLEPERIRYLLDAIHERQMINLRQILRHDVRDVVFRICGPEYATPPYLPPESFSYFVTDYLIDICQAIRQAGAIPRIHSHGRIGKVIDEFARTDALCLDPLEPPPDGDIELAEIKRQYGSRFCLLGNLELRELEWADRQRIDQLVKEAMDAAKSGSGFILMPTAAPISIPLSARTEENYLQFIDSGLKYGQY